MSVTIQCGTVLLRLTRIPLEFCHSQLTPQQKKYLQSVSTKIGAIITSTYNYTSTTHLVTPKRSSTAKTICAWAMGIPTIRMSYVEALVGRKDNNFRKNYDYMDRTEGLGGEGTITCTVDGKHLRWFRGILEEARNETSSIKHILVQAHVLVIKPVRKVSSSGQFMDHAENSEFWKSMVEFGVDLYLAGEVHATTVTKDPNSNLLQIVSRGNSCNNFLKINVTDDSLTVTSYDEVGPLQVYNKNYTINGNLLVDKTGETTIESDGILELLDRSGPVIYFNFDEIVPIGERKVLGLKHDDYKQTLIAEKITIRDTICRDAVVNLGTFGQQYDAQIGSFNIAEGIYGSNAIEFTSDSSCLAIFSTGPHSAGDPISYTLWFKTSETGSEMILIHYGNMWYTEEEKNIFLMMLKDGTPVSYTDPSILTTRDPQNLNDGKWHHMAVMMPWKSCLVSEVKIIVDGEEVHTELSNYHNEHLFFHTGGRLSLGGFGYSWNSFEDLYPDLTPFVGYMDEFYMWAKPINSHELKLAMRKKLEYKSNVLCKRDSTRRRVHIGNQNGYVKYNARIEILVGVMN